MNFKRIVKKFIPHFLLNFYHYLLALIGAIVFGFPSKKLMVIGVTGTSGKSTTIDFITRILEENGDRVASLSSIRFRIGNKESKNEMKMTMPGRFVIQKFLRQAVDEKCKYAVLEVTSEGIKQFRHKFINFDTAVFLNLTPEHIDSHGSFENYRNAKLQLFSARGGSALGGKAIQNLHVINIDDPNAKYFLDIPAQKIITFGLSQGDVNTKNTPFQLNILGDFNRYNGLAAVATTMSHGVSLQICQQALEKVTGLPGRLEVVVKDPLVVVDYAFTPEQLEASYKSVKQFSGGKSLVCVLGACGGGRDKWKRSVLGGLAQQYCREIIITDEDPYDEDPLEIMEQVADGINNEIKPYHIVLDRKEAIKKALELATPQDAVVITGKGAEPLMCLADGKKIPWSDKQIVKDYFVIDKNI